MAVIQKQVQQGLALVLGDWRKDCEYCGPTLPAGSEDSLSLRYRCANTSMHWWKMTGKGPGAVFPSLMSLAAEAYRRK